MKHFSLVSLFCLFLIVGCTSDGDRDQTENGVNPAPNQRTTGSSAFDFLSAEDYEELVIEIMYVDGFRPTTQTIVNLRNFLLERLNKPGGITIREREIESPGSSPYTLDEIRGIEDKNRSVYNDVNKLALYIFFADGKASTDTANTFTLGTAYRNTSCVIYENTIINYTNRPNGPDRTALESTVLQHEICHLLGLVNFGTPMQDPHEDEDRNRHCDNVGCLMYWQAQMIVDGIVPRLDANCLADLRSNGGK